MAINIYEFVAYFENIFPSPLRQDFNHTIQKNKYFFLADYFIATHNNVHKNISTRKKIPINADSLTLCADRNIKMLRNGFQTDYHYDNGTDASISLWFIYI